MLIKDNRMLRYKYFLSKTYLGSSYKSLTLKYLYLNILNKQKNHIYFFILLDIEANEIYNIIEKI